MGLVKATGFSAHLETGGTKELDGTAVKLWVRNKTKTKKKMSSSSMALRDMQRDLEAKANDLAKIQKGNRFPRFEIFLLFVSKKNLVSYLRNREESPAEEEVYDPTRWERARS